MALTLQYHMEFFSTYILLEFAYIYIYAYLIAPPLIVNTSAGEQGPEEERPLLRLTDQ